MKAWFIKEKDSDWGILVHGENVAKVKMRAKAVWPGDEFIWILIRVTREPYLDDLPLSAENTAKFFMDDNTGDNLKLEDYHNFCNCSLCKEKND